MHKVVKGLLPEADYPAVIESIEDTISNTSGNPMFIVVFATGPNLATPVKDYVIHGSWREKALAKALGWKGNELSVTQAIGASLVLSLKIETDQKGKYPPKMAVGAYKPADQAARSERVVREANAAAKAASAEAGDDDDIPF